MEEGAWRQNEIYSYIGVQIIFIVGLSTLRSVRELKIEIVP